jgi:aminopeptidase N
MRSNSFLLFTVGILFSCQASKIKAITELDELNIQANTKEVSANTIVPSARRLIDLTHLDLIIQPDWKTKTISGSARYKAKMGPRGGDRILLNAKGMVIKRVALIHQADTLNLKFEYNSYVIDAALDRAYGGGEEMHFQIDYQARPNELHLHCPDLDPYERGFYFVEPGPYTATKPKQCWTQNEPEAASVWFPTFDVPNQQFTHTLKALIPTGMVSLSNGIQKGVRPGSLPGTEWHEWEMNMPHAPYLVMFAAGPFSITKDEWKGKPVHYYTDSAYADQARNIFGKTSKMLDFFSSILKTPYPWQKYHQIVVQDFPSGAMENTTAVVFGEFVQRDSSELSQMGNELIVAHELFHHWFGDLVTCESWANLPLNESFANYSEYLWLEHEYGKEVADEQHYEDLIGYLWETHPYQGNKLEPLIRYENNSPHDMFDAHSYNKGGRVLHMLRRTLGDSLFFEGLRVYLNEHAHQPVEVHDLRLAFEKVSGEDLMLFFNQWFLTKGHPFVDVRYNWDNNMKQLRMVINQEQINLERSSSLFKLSFTTAIYLRDTVLYIPLVAQAASDTFRFTLPEYPLAVDWDNGRYLLAESRENLTLPWCSFLFRNQPHFLLQMAMLKMAADKFKLEPGFDELILEASQSPFPLIRKEAAELMGELTASWIENRLEEMAFQDSDSRVRLEAQQVLSEKLNGEEAKKMAIRIMDAHPSMDSRRLAFTLDPQLALAWKPSILRPESDLIAAQAGIWAEKDLGKDVSWYEQNFTLLSDPDAENEFLSSMGKFLTRRSLDEQLRGFQMLESILAADPSWIVRLGIYGAIADLGNALSESKVPGAEALLEELERRFYPYFLRERNAELLQYLR